LTRDSDLASPSRWRNAGCGCCCLSAGTGCSCGHSTVQPILVTGECTEKTTTNKKYIQKRQIIILRKVKLFKVQEFEVQNSKDKTKVLLKGYFSNGKKY